MLSGPAHELARSEGESPASAKELVYQPILIMFAAGITVLRPRSMAGDPNAKLTSKSVIRLLCLGLAAGIVSGFFGIGGGFLVVPGIMLGSGLPILNAIGSSLFSVAAFGLTTAVNYALSDFVDFRVAIEFIAGGAIGGFFGIKACVRLGSHKRLLNYVFAAVVFAVGGYMLVRTGVQILSA